MINGCNNIFVKPTKFCIDKRVVKFYTRLVFGKQNWTGLTLKEIIGICVHKAYVTVSRSLSGLMQCVKKNGQHYFETKLVQEIETLLNGLVSKQYDDWHKDICDDIVKYYISCKHVVFSYGVIQKILNLTMKFIYCLVETKYITIIFNGFNKCHATLDSEVIKYINKNTSYKTQMSLRDIDTYNKYMDYQNALRSAFPNISPFFKEFDIW